MGDAEDRGWSFVWATDVDLKYESAWLWNYIENTSAAEGWAGRWEKGGIAVPLSRPLPKGGRACRKVFLGNFDPSPDTDAPIVYGLSNTVQEAAVFIRLAKEPVHSFGLEVEGSFVENDEMKSLTASIYFSRKGDGQLLFEYSISDPEYTIGISNLEEFLPGERYSAFTSSFAETLNKEAIYVSSLEKVSPEAAKDFLLDADAANQTYTFMTGSTGGSFQFFGGEQDFLSPELRLEVVFLDSDAAPILASFIDVPAPAL